MMLGRGLLALSLCATPVLASAAESTAPAPSAAMKMPDKTAGSAASSMGTTMPTAIAGDIAVENGFARAMLPGASVGGGYLTISNRGSAPDRLIAVSSPSSAEVDVHEMKMDGAVMRMRALEAPLAVPAGQTVQLQPNGMHLMFSRVSAPFRQGSEVAVTLTFEKAGRIDLRLPVLAANAKAPASGEAMGGMDMPR